MRISDWSSDVCSSDLALELADQLAELLAFLEVIDGHIHRTLPDADHFGGGTGAGGGEQGVENVAAGIDLADHRVGIDFDTVEYDMAREAGVDEAARVGGDALRSEEHTSELPSLMRNSYA